MSIFKSNKSVSIYTRQRIKEQYTKRFLQIYNNKRFYRKGTRTNIHYNIYLYVSDILFFETHLKLCRY